jgi:hypothetical protein
VIQSQAHKRIKAPDHPHAYSNGYYREHRIIVENALGKTLPVTSPVHHHGVYLVACQDQAYHNLLHMRTRALKESGNANNRLCVFCKVYGNAESVINISGKKGDTFGHPDCKKKADAEWYEANKEKCRIKNHKNYMKRQLNEKTDIILSILGHGREMSHAEIKRKAEHDFRQMQERKNQKKVKLCTRSL